MINLIKTITDHIGLKVPKKELVDILFDKDITFYLDDANKETDRLFASSSGTRERCEIWDKCTDGKLAEILIKELFPDQFIEVGPNSLIKFVSDKWLDLSKNIGNAIIYHDLIHITSGEVVEIKRWAPDVIEQKLKLFKERDCKKYNFSHWIIICSYDKANTWIHSIERLR